MTKRREEFNCSDAASLLVVNAGSSSLKFALYSATGVQQIGRGKIERIGLPGTAFKLNEPTAQKARRELGDCADHAHAADALIDWLQQHGALALIEAVGHRVVHGGARYVTPTLIDDDLVQELRSISDYALEHLPAEIELIERFRRRLPAVPHVACFDTAFHRAMPRVAELLPLPRRFDAKGIRRFGFHGLSYQYLIEELERIAGDAARGRVIIAHLGNGSSLAALSQGKSIDTSMSFTPASGVLMGTRSGDLDPGLALYLARTENIDAEQFNRIVNLESGLFGVSEISADMQQLLAHEASDPRAAEAVALYCYQIMKTIGAFAAALGGLDTLVFSGGIGENAAVIRQRICERLGFLGVRIDATRNASNDGVISSSDAPVTVRMIETDEESVIAQVTRCVVAQAAKANTT